MKRYRLRINIVEIGRVVEIVAPSKRAARIMARAGMWDPEIGATDPEEFRNTVVGKVEEINP